MTSTTKDLIGRVAVVTGANTGIGKVTARVLAERGARVVIACRSEEKARPVLEEIRSGSGNPDVELLRLDLASLASVRDAARELLARDLPIHMLINNAGLAGPRGQTTDGFELAFGVNHVGHFLFTKLLLPRVVESAPARVVTVSSIGHYRATSIDWDAVRRPTASFTGLPEYQVSKLANVLFSAELARRATEGVTTYSLHPGGVATDVWRRIPWPFRPLMKAFMLTEEEGAQTTLHCATAGGETARESGLYYEKCRVKEPSALSQDQTLAADLWKRSEAWVAPFAD